MQKITNAILVAALLLGVLSSAAFAQAEAPAGAVGACPARFDYHMPMDHDHEAGHLHVGTMADKNGDGWICVLHATPTQKVHVHIDNSLPLP